MWHRVVWYYFSVVSFVFRVEELCLLFTRFALGPWRWLQKFPYKCKLLPGYTISNPRSSCYSRRIRCMLIRIFCPDCITWTKFVLYMNMMTMTEFMWKLTHSPIVKWMEVSGEFHALPGLTCRTSSKWLLFRS